MNFYGDECDHCKMINIDFFLNCARSVQTSIVSWKYAKNWIQKDRIFVMLSCTNIVWQNCDTSSTFSASPKHHFSNFFSRLLNCRKEEGTIKLAWNVWKSVVFSIFNWNTDASKIWSWSETDVCDFLLQNKLHAMTTWTTNTGTLRLICWWV